MSVAIAVMGDDDGTTSSLILRLGALGFDAIPARRESRAFAKVLEAADIILCDRVEQAVRATDAVGRLPAPYILLADALPDADSLLKAMRLGIIDVVTLPASDETVGRRLRAGIDRAKPTDLRIAGQLDSLERDQRAGRYIQRRMLPPSPYAIDRYRLTHRVQPSMILSGDFVDYFRIADKHFVFYIADVSGHGASSAFVTVILRNFSRRLRREYRSKMLTAPGEMLGALNRELMEQNLGKHVTMFIGVVDVQHDTVYYANAGHFPHAIHAGHDGGSHATYIEAPGKPVGLFDEVQYEPASIKLEPGDSVVAFSDGVLELMHDDGLPAKEARLVECSAAAAPDIDGLWEGLGIAPESPGPDDVTCLVVQRTS